MENKLRFILVLVLASTGALIVGCYTSGWAVLGIALMLWANNIERGIKWEKECKHTNTHSKRVCIDCGKDMTI